ncbi:MAG: hypothetical protein ACRDGN_11420, partial [bacterium]
MELPPPLFEFLHQGAAGLLVTVGADGWPHTAFTWIGAPDPARVRVVIDEGSTTLANVNASLRGAAQVIGPDSLLYLVKGSIALARNERKMPAGLRIVLADLSPSEVKDQGWAPVTVMPLRYVW